MLGVIVAITAGIVLYILFFGNQYTVRFDSNGGSEVEDQTVTAGEKATEPEEPTRDGYNFIEWQLRGEAFDFATRIRRNITLIARWQRITNVADLLYTVTFDSAGGSAVEAQEVEEGEKATKPANPTRTGFAFQGWFHDNTEFDFNQEIVSNLILTAKWRQTANESRPGNNAGNNVGNNALDPNLKVGDRVEIIGAYASSSTSTEALHSRARGWQRVILKIYEGREFPYRVGNSTGTTGFFQADSLRKIN
jgi:uncharacterized repeat protein (TIGR02543 family)